jgi:ribosome-associated protein
LTNGTTTAGVRGPGGDDLPASRDVAVAAARAASGKQAEDIVVLDVSEVIVITDYFVLCTATSSRQVKTVIEAVEEEIRALGVRPVRREGEADAGWWLLDYVDVVVHVFGVEEREYYDLERLWRDAPVEDWEDASLASGA